MTSSSLVFTAIVSPNVTSVVSLGMVDGSGQPTEHVALPSETDAEGLHHRALEPPSPTAIRIPGDTRLAFRRSWSGRPLPRPPPSNRSCLTGPSLAGPATHGNSLLGPFSARAREDRGRIG
jgi:hypothetical protein